MILVDKCSISWWTQITDRNDIWGFSCRMGMNAGKDWEATGNKLDQCQQGYKVSGKLANY